MNKLGIALAIIFCLSVTFLFLELFYVLWRRRIFHRQTRNNETSSSEPIFSSVAASKELLYFFCLRPDVQQSSIDTATKDLGSNEEVIDIDMLALQGMFGPPRFLFTIKEDNEKEYMESPAVDQKSLCIVSNCDHEKELNKTKKVGDDFDINNVEEEHDDHDDHQSVVEIIDYDDDDDDDVTPFSTPCASPLFFTPSASPVHDHNIVHFPVPRIAIGDEAV